MKLFFLSHLLRAEPRRTHSLVLSSCWLLELCDHGSDVNNLIKRKTCKRRLWLVFMYVESFTYISVF